MFKLMDLAISMGKVDSQGEWLKKIGSNDRASSQLKNYAIGFQLRHIQAAVDLVGSDYNYVFGYKGKVKNTDLDRIKTTLKNLIKDL